MAWQSTYDWLYNLVNSNFSCALFGAGFGAWAASWIALRSERQKRRREEIAVCNTALGLAATIIETALNMRSQFILPMASAYSARFEKFVADEMRPGPPHELKVIAFTADLGVLYFQRYQFPNSKYCFNLRPPIRRRREQSSVIWPSRRRRSM